MVGLRSPALPFLALALFLLLRHKPRKDLLSEINATLQQAASDVPPPPSLCSLLARRTLLLVGSEQTYHLHDILLRTLSHSPSQCPSSQFCTWHLLCAPSPIPTHRVKLPPSLTSSSNASILRYIPSTTLFASPNPNHPRYIYPSVDPDTGVRVRDGYWRAKARSVLGDGGVLLIGRGPVPAPTWTFDNGWNGSFGRSTGLCRNEAQNANCETADAALHATLTKFLPSVRDTLRLLTSDASTRNGRIIWHGNWYTNISGEQLLRRHLAQKKVADDPWSLYYNAQVYMQNRILPTILTSFGIAYLPMSSSEGKLETIFLSGLAGKMHRLGW